MKDGLLPITCEKCGLTGVLQLREGTSVMDVGAGTGTLSGILSRLSGPARVNVFETLRKII
jgi:protein-L-isoaspartate O-methyltransferase